MVKTIWFINHYASHMLFSKGGRHYNFAKYLDRMGYESVVFCANIMNNKTDERCIETEDLWTEKEATEIHTPFVYIKARKYHGNGRQRVLNMLDFFSNVKKAAKEYAVQRGKPDIIIASSVHPLAMVAGIQLGKYFGVKCICEVRDLWPESIFVYSSKIRQNSLIGKCLYKGEKWIYKNADAVIFTMAGGKDYITEHKWDTSNLGPIDLKNIFHISNGVDLEVFDRYVNEFCYSDPDLEDGSIFKVVYAGSIRKVNKIDILLDAAKLIDSKNVKFLIFGDGDELERLKERTKKEKITNVIFKGRVEKKFIPSIDSRSDLNIVHWESTSLINYGDSSNKSFEYYAAGKPVLYTTSPAYSVVNEYNCGVVIEDQSASTIANAIIDIINLSDNEKIKIGFNARRAAEFYDFKNLTSLLVKIIENL